MAISLTVKGPQGPEAFEFQLVPPDLAWCLRNHSQPLSIVEKGPPITWQQMAAILTHVETAATANLSDEDARAACYAEAARRAG